MLINDGRSRNVYENKQNNDKMPDEMSDICVESTRILQNISGLEGQITLNGALGGCFLRKFIGISESSDPSGSPRHSGTGHTCLPPPGKCIPASLPNGPYLESPWLLSIMLKKIK